MKLLKKFASVSTALFISLASLMAVNVQHAFAATATWTGGGSDNNMSTAANWGGTAPVAGDDLVFPANITKVTVVNDYTAGTSFNSITFSGAATQDSSYTLSGNALTVVGGITSSMTGNYVVSQTITAPVTLGGAQTISNSGFNILTLTDLNLSTYATTLDGSIAINGTLSGSGSLTITGTYASTTLSGDNSSYSGNITVNSGNLRAITSTALGTSAGSTTIASGASLAFCFVSNDVTISEPLNISGNGTDASIFGTKSCTGGGGSGIATSAPASFTLTDSGAITLNANAMYSGYYTNLKFSGTFTDNSHALSVFEGTYGDVIIGSNTISAPVVTHTIAASDSDATGYVYAGKNVTEILDGTRGTVTLNDGSVLKGTGTTNNLYAGYNTIVAPGHSPGKLTVLQNLELDANAKYQAEIQTKDNYDQLQVGSASITTGHAVVLGTPTTFDTNNNPTAVTGAPDLEVSIFGTATINKTDTFTIIDNLSKTDVLGTFKNLPEGATFKLNGGVFKITYKGGDGNDVVLSVVTVPTVANTGFKLLMSSPLAIVAATAAIAGGAYVLSRRFAYAKAKK